jgi:hypothetical protein
MVPVDFSDCSLAGLTYAVRFAKEVGVRIRCGDQMQAFLKRVHFDGVPVDGCAVAGFCPAAIYEAAAKEGADLIIISTHGRTGLRHALIGSVAEGTVRNAACPVLVVPSFARVRKELVNKTARRRGEQSLESAPKPK